MKTKLVLLYTVICSLAFTSCINSKKENLESLRYPDDFVNINVPGAYGIHIPKTMKSTTGLNSEALVQYQNTDNEMYTLVFDEPRNVLDDTLQDMGYEETSSIAVYRDLQLEQLAKRMNITHQSAPTPLTISGWDAESLEIDANVDNITEELSYFLTFVEGKTEIYTIMSWTLKSRKQEHKKTFETIARSFEINP